MAVFIIFIMAISLILTVLNQLKLLDKFSRYPVFFHLSSFIPRWNFFAPIPCMHDYHLLYRVLSKDGKLSDWKQTETLFKRSKPSFFWNVSKRPSKAFIDIFLDLLQLCLKEKDPKKICISIPYLYLLKHVDTLCTNENDNKVQFLILRDSKTVDLEVAFLSELHPVIQKYANC